MRLAVSKNILRAWFAPVTIMLLFNAFHMLGLKNFEPWPQVTIIWNGFASLVDYVDHFHFYRLVVASPGLWLEDQLMDHGFSIYASFFLLWSSMLFSNIQQTIAGYRPQLWAWGVLIVLFCLMNGRGTIGWTGWLLVVSTCLSVANANRAKLALGTMLRIALGLLLATVSSGIYVYSFLIFAYFWLLRSDSGTSYQGLTYMGIFNRIFGITLLASSLYFVLQQVFWAIQRVVDFYGGGLAGVAGVMSHGIASKLDHIGPMHVVLAFILFLSVISFFAAGYAQKIGSDLVVIIFATLVGGVFGITILTLAIPLMLVAIGKLFRFRLAWRHAL